MDTLTQETPEMGNDLPSTEAFLAEFGIDARPTQVVPTKAESRQAVQAAGGVSKEFRDLLIQYCATMVSAYELEDINWGALAKRLGTHAEFLREAAESLNLQGALWSEVLGARIKRATAARIFRDSAWEQLESMAVNKLINMAERNLIRDPGELLAVASAARRASTDSKAPASGTTVNVINNIGGESMDESGLPAAGAKMTIDLSPRVASALSRRREPQAEVGGRVIDGQMLSAQELRNALEASKAPPSESGTSETDMFNEPSAHEGDES
jgi:hypothetical protein